jgi:glycosyltransferase involved in cell wall biosynthesis
MIIIHVIDNLNTGGAEKQFRNIIRLFEKEDTSIYLFFPCFDKKQDIPEDLEKIAKDIIVANKFYKIDIFKIISKLNSLIRSVNPHIVHSWLYYSNIINVLSYRRNQKKIISQRFGYHSCFEDNIYNFWRKKTINAIDAHADLLIVNSLGNHKYLVDKVKYPSNKIRYIPNAVSILHEFIKNDYALQSKTIKLLHVGNFVKEKNHFIFIPLMKELIKKYPAKLSLIGDGPLKDDFFKAVNREGLGDHVDYMGKLANASLTMKEYDIFVYPSISEGMPNALMEAMACGLPSVCFDIDGNAELIKNNISGYLVKKNDVTGLINSCAQLIDNDLSRENFGKNSVTYMKENFSIEKIFSKYKDLYSDLTE